MATSFNLTANLNLAGPFNVKPVVNALQAQLSNIKATVSINISTSTTSSIGTLNTAIGKLNTNLLAATTNANALKAALQGLGANFSSANSTMNATAGALNKVNSSASNAAKSLGSATTDMSKFGREAALAVKRAGAFALATGAIFGLARALDSGISKAIEFEKGIVTLQQVTRQSKEGLKGLTNEIDHLSTKLGVNSHELLEVAKTFTQAGLSINDTKIALDAVAKSALAPSFDSIINTTEGLIAVMGQFKDEMTGVGIGAKDFEKVLGSINKVSADFAVEADDIVSAIRRMGGVFAAASRGIGTPVDQLNELIAVFTSVRATTRESADSISTGLRTIFTRIQRPETIDFLKQFGVELIGLDGKFVGPYEAIKRLSEALKTLDTRDIRFAQITEELGGIRQVGKLIPAIKEFATAQRVLGVAVAGQTSLDEDAAIAQESLANKLTKTREEFLKLVRDLTNTSGFKLFANTALEAASAVIKIADSVKELIPALTALFAIRGLRSGHELLSGFVGSFRGNAGPARRNLGGPIHAFASGGLVPGVGDTDTVPATLTPGEFVIRKKAVESIGVNRLQRLNGGGGVVDNNRGFYGNQDVASARKLFDLLRIDPTAGVSKIGNNVDYTKTSQSFDKGDILKRILPNIPSDTPPDQRATIEAALRDRATFLEIQRGRAGTESKLGSQRIQDKDIQKYGNTIGINIGDLNGPPKFGGLFLRPAPGQDKTAIQNVTISSLKNAGLLQAKYRDKYKEKLSPNSKVFANVGLNFIEPETAKKMESDIDHEFARSVTNLTSTYGRGFSPKLDPKEVIKTSGLESVSGHMFEALVSTLTNNQKVSNDAGFDIDRANVSAIEKLFGPTHGSLDLKRTFSNDTVKSLFEKAINSNLLNDIQPTKGFHIAEHSNVKHGISLFAKGGRASDTVPALLTPGEFVVHKEAAQRIGYSKLNALNQADRIPVRGYADGGVVGGGIVHQGKGMYGEPLGFIKTGADAAKAVGALPVIPPALTTALNALVSTLLKTEEKAKQLGLSAAEVAPAIKALRGGAGGTVTSLSGMTVELNKIARVKLEEQLKLLGKSTVQVNKSLAHFDKAIAAGTTGIDAATQIYMRSKPTSKQIAKKEAATADAAEKAKNLRNNRLNNIRQIGYGAIGVGATVGAYLPEAKTASGAGIKGAISGTAGGLGIGLEIGSVLGPSGAIIGGAVGGLVGGIKAAQDSFYNFKANESLKKLETAILIASESFSKLKFNPKTAQEEELLVKTLKDIRENIERGQGSIEDAENNTRNRSKNDVYNNIGNTSFGGLSSAFTEGVFGKFASDAIRNSGPGGTLLGIADEVSLSGLGRSIGSVFGAGTPEEQIGRGNIQEEINIQKSSREAGKPLAETLLKTLQEQATKTNAGISVYENLTPKEIQLLGSQSREAQQKVDLQVKYAPKRISADKERLEAYTKIISEKEFAIAGEAERKRALEVTKNAIEMERLSRQVSTASNNLELFSNNLTKSIEILSSIENIQNIGNQKSSELLNRGSGNFSNFNIQNDNIFKRPQTATTDEFKEGFAFLRKTLGSSDALNNRETGVIAVKQLTDNLPSLLKEFEGKTDADVQSLRSKLNDSIDAASSNGVPAAVIDQTKAELEKLFTAASGEKIKIGDIENIAKKLASNGAAYIQNTAEIFEKSKDVINNGLAGVASATKAKFEVSDRLAEARSSRDSGLLGLQEEKSGKIDLEARQRIEQAKVQNLVGPGKSTDIDNIARAIEEGDKNIDKMLSELGTKPASEAELLELTNLRNSTDRNRKALEHLSKSTEGLANITAKLGELRSKESAGKDLARNFITGTAESRQDTLTSLKLANILANGREKDKDRILASGGPEGLASKAYAGIDLVRKFAPKQADKMERDILVKLAGGGKKGKEKLKELGIDIDEMDRLEDAQSKFIMEQYKASEKLASLNEKNVIGALETSFDTLRLSLDKLNQAIAQGNAKTIDRDESVFFDTKANGGLIRGPGTGTSDSIPTRLSHGEYVVKAASVSKLGPEVLSHINETGEIPGFRDGSLINTKKKKTRAEIQKENEERYEKTLAFQARNNNGLAYQTDKHGDPLYKIESGGKFIDKKFNRIDNPFKERNIRQQKIVEKGRSDAQKARDFYDRIKNRRLQKEQIKLQNEKISSEVDKFELDRIMKPHNEASDKLGAAQKEAALNASNFRNGIFGELTEKEKLNISLREKKLQASIDKNNEKYNTPEAQEKRLKLVKEDQERNSSYNRISNSGRLFNNINNQKVDPNTVDNLLNNKYKNKIYRQTGTIAELKKHFPDADFGEVTEGDIAVMSSDAFGQYIRRLEASQNRYFSNYNRNEENKKEAELSRQQEARYIKYRKDNGLDDPDVIKSNLFKQQQKELDEKNAVSKSITDKFPKDRLAGTGGHFIAEKIIQATKGISSNIPNTGISFNSKVGFNRLGKISDGLKSTGIDKPLNFLFHPIGNLFKNSEASIPVKVGKYIDNIMPDSYGKNNDTKREISEQYRIDFKESEDKRLKEKNSLMDAHIKELQKKNITDESIQDQLKYEKFIKFWEIRGDLKKVEELKSTVIDNREYYKNKKPEFVTLSDKEIQAGRELRPDLYRVNGGSISGPGSAGSDSILARVSNGEFLINSHAATRIGQGTLNHINNTGSLPRFASGGMVSTPRFKDGGSASAGFDFPDLSKIFTGFNSAATSLAAAIQEFVKIPHKIEGTITHSGTITLNGAEVLASIMPKIQEMIKTQLGSSIKQVTSADQRNEGNIA